MIAREPRATRVDFSAEALIVALAERRSLPEDLSVIGLLGLPD